MADFSDRIKQLQNISQAAAAIGAKELKASPGSLNIDEIYNRLQVMSSLFSMDRPEITEVVDTRTAEK